MLSCCSQRMKQVTKSSSPTPSEDHDGRQPARSIKQGAPFWKCRVRIEHRSLTSLRSNNSKSYHGRNIANALGRGTSARTDDRDLSEALRTRRRLPRRSSPSTVQSSWTPSSASAEFSPSTLRVNVWHCAPASSVSWSWSRRCASSCF